MQMATTKEKPVCSACGSDDVLMDAYAVWDNAAQDWVPNSTHEATVCNACEGECRIDWVPVADRDDREAQQALSDLEQSRDAH
jgi:hypothetical protein